MTTDRRFERDLPDLLADLYLGPTPDYRDDVLARASRVRQRPAWTFPERWLPMDLVERHRRLVPVLPWRALGVVALVALLLAALVATFAAGQRHVPPPFGVARNGVIAYAKDGDIYVRGDPAGTSRVLIGGAANDEAPLFSRQGDRFTFFRVVSDTGNCECEVWLANADGSGAHKLGGPYYNPQAWDWSPDGSSVVVSSTEAGHAVVTVVPTDGEAPRTLDLGIAAAAATWRPAAGDQILIRGGDPNGAGRLYLMKPDGTGLTALDLPSEGVAPADDFAHGFSWSPDGRRLAYTVAESLPASAGGSVGLRIHLAEIDPAGRVVSDRRLEFDPTADNELNPSWLPAGDRIVFQTREGETDYLSVADVPEGSATGRGTATKIGPSSSSGIGYEVAPDGHSLLALFFQEQTTWRYDLDAKTAAVAGLGPLDPASYQRLAP